MAKEGSDTQTTETGAKKKKISKITSAQKRVLQNHKHRLTNRSFKSRVKTAIHHFQEALTQSDPAIKDKRLSAVYQLVDKGVKIGQFKRNQAARTKSRLARRLHG